MECSINIIDRGENGNKLIFMIQKCVQNQINHHIVVVWVVKNVTTYEKPHLLGHHLIKLLGSDKAG